MDQMDAHEDGTVGFSLAEFGAAGEEAVVILKSNPIDLPMVCGLCGDQYATTRGNPYLGYCWFDFMLLLISFIFVCSRQSVRRQLCCYQSR